MNESRSPITNLTFQVHFCLSSENIALCFQIVVRERREDCDEKVLNSVPSPSTASALAFESICNAVVSHISGTPPSNFVTHFELNSGICRCQALMCGGSTLCQHGKSPGVLGCVH